MYLKLCYLSILSRNQDKLILVLCSYTVKRYVWALKNTILETCVFSSKLSSDDGDSKTTSKVLKTVK